MLHLRKFKLFYATIGMIIILTSTLFTTNFPFQGYLQPNNAPVSFRIGYFGDQASNQPLREWMNGLKDISLFAAADRLYAKTDKLPLLSFLPIYDSSSSAAEFAANYPYLPDNLLPNFGRTVYHIDYGNARLLFLDAAELKDENSPQLAWVKKTVDENKQTHNLVLINHDPKFPQFWELLRKVGINLVLIGDEVYVPHEVITQEATEYRPTEYSGWGIWKVSNQFSQPHLLILEGMDTQLTVKVQDQQGKRFDQMIVDVTNLRSTDDVSERALVSIQSLWRYHPGSKDVPAYIPKELDITGETPIQKAFTLPADDWRSPQYNDTTWQVGRAPLGHSQNKVDQRKIQKKLPVVKRSPVYYFRKTFEVEEDPALIKNLTLHVAYEDGFVAYLNGSEIYRDTIREGLVDYRSLGLPSEFNFYTMFPLKNHINKLIKGTNTLAVEIHRSHPRSPNLLFDLSLTYVK